MNEVKNKNKNLVEDFPSGNLFVISPVVKTLSKRTPEIGLLSTLGIQWWEKEPCGILPCFPY